MTNKQLNQIRLDLGLTINEFAKQLNTPVGTIKHWLDGSRRVPGIVEVALVYIVQKRTVL